MKDVAEPPGPTNPGSDEILRLLLTDSVTGRMELYLRLLYSPRYAAYTHALLESEPGRLPPNTAAFLRTLDMERLGIEQRARVRNLTFQLRERGGTLFSLFPEAEHVPMVSRFADSDLFWQARGRTIHENCCLFLVRELTPHDVLLADVVRFLGVLSGLRMARDLITPWAQWRHERLNLPGGESVERFHGGWMLLDKEGNPPGSAWVERLREHAPRRHEITVGITPEKNLIVDCQPC